MKKKEKTVKSKVKTAGEQIKEALIKTEELASAIKLGGE
jgi:hypothetical protein